MDIQQFQERWDMSQAQLSKELGVSVPTLRKYRKEGEAPQWLAWALYGLWRNLEDRVIEGER